MSLVKWLSIFYKVSFIFFCLLKLIYILGADTAVRSREGYTAHNWAVKCAKHSVAEIIALFDACSSNGLKTENPGVSDLLREYDKRVSPDVIDFNLIVSIIVHIHTIDRSNSILVFLPGYEDITICHDKIANSECLNMDDFEIFMLHSSLPMNAQHAVFSVIPRKQKIILATNIAETSITMNDVVFVIDTGLAKEKTYDSVSF